MSVLLFVCLIFQSTAYSQEEVEYLRKHAIEVSIDPANEDYSDLLPLKQYIGNSRIVLLGEQSHGDGSTFSTKVRLVKFLHEELGFEVLAFESGIFESRFAWDRILEGGPVAGTLKEAVYPLWSRTEELVPLFTFIEQTLPNSSPLIVSGFDPQLPAGTKIRQEILLSFLAYLKRKGKTLGDWAEEENFINHWYALETRSHPNQKFITGKLNYPLFMKTLSRVTNEITTGAQQDDIKWNLFFRSMAAFMPVLANRTKALSALQDSAINIDVLRDSVMAVNLMRLATHVYPDKKIVVWAASWHIARGKGRMGYFLNKYGSEKMYSIGFTAANGHMRDFITNKEKPLPQISANSFEDLFMRSGLQNCFLDLITTSETKKGKWLMDMRIMRPFGYVDVNNRWPKVFDGIIFNREMRPSHLVED